MEISTTSGPGTADYYDRFFLTSAAAPHVCGAAALLWAANPSAAPDEIKAALLESVDLIPAFTNKMVSHGRLNIGRAMQHPNIDSNQPPVIASQPASVVVVQGGTATFSVGAWGIRREYQWQHQGAPLFGETNSTLTISNVTVQQGGDYRVVVANPVGAVTSAVAVLTVLIPPRIIEPITPLHFGAITGETITLSVSIVGSLPIGYRWRHIRTNGSSVNLTNMVLHENSCFLTLPVGTNSAGTYTLILTNAAQRTPGIQWTNAFLTVLADGDGDGMADAWESLARVDDPHLDADNDGLSNLQEYLAHTDPQDPESCLQLEPLAFDPNPIISFRAVSNRTYTIQFADNLGAQTWSNLSDVVGHGVNHTAVVHDVQAPANRFYRLVTPRR